MLWFLSSALLQDYWCDQHCVGLASKKVLETLSAMFWQLGISFLESRFFGSLVYSLAAIQVTSFSRYIVETSNVSGSL